MIDQESNNEQTRSIEPAYTSSLSDIMTSLMIGKMKPRHFQDAKGVLNYLTKQWETTNEEYEENDP